MYGGSKEDVHKENSKSAVGPRLVRVRTRYESTSSQVRLKLGRAKLAALYGKAVFADPAQKAVYVSAAKTRQKPLFSLAVSD